MHRRLLLLSIPALISCGNSTGPSIDTSIKEGSVALSAIVRDVAYDSKRSTLHLSQPDLKQIGVFHLSSQTFDTPISTLTHTPAGLDLILKSFRGETPCRRGIGAEALVCLLVDLLVADRLG